MITSTWREGGEGTIIKESIVTTHMQASKQASKHAAINTRVSGPASKIRKKQEAWNKSLRACQQDKKEAGVVEGGREGGREEKGQA